MGVSGDPLVLDSIFKVVIIVILIVVIATIAVIYNSFRLVW